MNPLLISVVLVLCPFACNSYELSVIHINDIHVRLEETDVYSGVCKETNQQGCYGGIARVHQAVKSIKSKDENSIFVNAGDFYQGNSFYTLFKWSVVAPFANKLNCDAMSPGNHEFDDGVDGYVPFLKNISFPVICANMDVSEEPSLEGLFKKSVVVERGGKKIGIIGYLTPETKILAHLGKVNLSDEVESISKEAKLLKESGVDILIAVGHSGYDVDKKIAQEVEDIDAVVGGHSHSFLYTGKPPSVEKPAGPYPTLITQSSGRVVPVVQAYAYTKYLGYLKLTFDENGEVTQWTGSPILLDSSYPQDPDVLEMLKPWKKQLDEKTNEVIGETRVLLSPSRHEESNLGNFITDSMVDWYVDHPKKRARHWTRAASAFLNSGGIRGSFTSGNITINDMLTVIPFENDVDVVSVKGETLKEVFEFSVSKMTPDGSGSAGGFLQVSGFRVTYDLREEPGHRLKELLIRCADCLVPNFSPVEDQKVYDVITVGYLANGGDGYTMLDEQKLDHFKGAKDTEVFRAYLAKRSPVTQGIENRITIITSNTPSESFTPSGSALQESNLILLAMLCIASLLTSSDLS